MFLTGIELRWKPSTYYILHTEKTHRRSRFVESDYFHHPDLASEPNKICENFEANRDLGNINSFGQNRFLALHNSVLVFQCWRWRSHFQVQISLNKMSVRGTLGKWRWRTFQQIVLKKISVILLNWVYNCWNQTE